MFLQWIEIQAHKMKMKPEEMKTVVKQKQEDFSDLLKSLEATVFSTPKQVTAFVESYQDGLTWFPGGTREVKTLFSGDLSYCAIESKIDAMTEYVHVMADMSSVLANSHGKQATALVSSPTVRIQRTLDEYKQRDKLWGPIICSQGRIWNDHNLPFEALFLKDGASHLLDLATGLALSVVTETKNIHGLLVSFGCTRTNKVKSFLLQALDVLLDCTKYIEHSSGQNNLAVQECVSSLASCHLRISCDQYEGFVYLSTQQSVCTHFEETLKVLSKTKEIIKKQNGLKNFSNGYIDYLPAPENLVVQMNNSCNLLLRHVQNAVNETLLHLEDTDVEKSSHLYKEMICWLIFSCKYAERNLEVIGNREEEGMSGLQDLLEGLQSLESVLGSS
jgi:hypothetical protein